MTTSEFKEKISALAEQFADEQGVKNLEVEVCFNETTTTPYGSWEPAITTRRCDVKITM